MEIWNGGIMGLADFKLSKKDEVLATIHRARHFPLYYPIFQFSTIP
jgi:hypothetical protein